jgi:hypothetical protein
VEQELLLIRDIVERTLVNCNWLQEKEQGDKQQSTKKNKK